VLVRVTAPRSPRRYRWLREEAYERSEGGGRLDRSVVMQRRQAMHVPAVSAKSCWRMRVGTLNRVTVP
jgi:hypothetical protein